MKVGEMQSIGIYRNDTEHMADVIIQHNATQKNLIQEPETELKDFEYSSSKSRKIFLVFR
jgi:hypothetical protein